MTVRILVGCPTSEHKGYCLKEYLDGVKELTYPKFDFLLVDNSENDEYFKKIESMKVDVVKGPYFSSAKERIVASRNLLREKVLDEGYDYFLSLEQDVVPPKDVIERLLDLDKKVITGVVFTKYEIGGEKRFKPLVWGFQEKEDRMRFMDTEVAKGGIYRIKACGLGCLLIHRSVLEKIKFRLFDGENTFDDIPFCKDCEDNGFEIYVDADVKCKHYIEGMDWDSIEG